MGKLFDAELDSIFTTKVLLLCSYIESRCLGALEILLPK